MRSETQHAHRSNGLKEQNKWNLHPKKQLGHTKTLREIS